MKGKIEIYFEDQGKHTLGQLTDIVQRNLQKHNVKTELRRAEVLEL